MPNKYQLLLQPLSFAHLANLHTLDLSHNKLQVVQQGEITGSSHLTVRLQGDLRKITQEVTKNYLICVSKP